MILGQIFDLLRLGIVRFRSLAVNVEQTKYKKKTYTKD